MSEVSAAGTVELDAVADVTLTSIAKAEVSLEYRATVSIGPAACDGGAFALDDTQSFTADFALDGAALNPDTVSLKFRVKNGDEIALTWAGSEIANTAEGAFSAPVSLEQSGRWHGLWQGAYESEGQCAIKSFSFVVNP